MSSLKKKEYERATNRISTFLSIYLIPCFVYVLASEHPFYLLNLSVFTLFDSPECLWLRASWSPSRLATCVSVHHLLLVTHIFSVFWELMEIISIFYFLASYICCYLDNILCSYIFIGFVESPDCLMTESHKVSHPPRYLRLCSSSFTYIIYIWHCWELTKSLQDVYIILDFLCLERLYYEWVLARKKKQRRSFLLLVVFPYSPPLVYVLF